MDLMYDRPDGHRASGTRRVIILAASALAVRALGLAAGETCSDHLLVIERSKNSNIVVYDARLAPSGDLEKSKPVLVYWLLNGDKSRRKELTRLQRDYAYGMDVTPGGAPGTYKMVLKAERERPMTIRMLNGCPVATTTIGGKNGIVRKLFIKSKEGSLMPKVLSVEFYGEDPDDGQPLYEKYVPPL